LFGKGAGIAFFILMAHLTSKSPTGAIARLVVLAESFTATAVVLQPITGVALARNIGNSLTDGWSFSNHSLCSEPAHSGCRMYGADAYADRLIVLVPVLLAEPVG
jgi:hypothetical protein